jgi:hypothetical protein
MTITESELREILTGEGSDDQHRGVTVADVDRRVRVIRRRRLRVVGAVAGLGIVAGLAFAVPQVKNTVVPEDIWTGVMTQPTEPAKTPKVVSTSVGGLMNMGMLDSRRYEEGGVRKGFAVTTGSSRISVRLWCEGPLMKAVLWVDGKLVQAGPCGERDRSSTYGFAWNGPQKDRATRHTVSGAVLRVASRSPERLTGTADVEHLLAANDRFDVKWELSVEKIGLPACRDNVIQVDPVTGEVVRLRCDEESTTPPAIP